MKVFCFLHFVAVSALFRGFLTLYFPGGIVTRATTSNIHRWAWKIDGAIQKTQWWLDSTPAVLSPYYPVWARGYQTNLTAFDFWNPFLADSTIFWNAVGGLRTWWIRFQWRLAQHGCGSRYRFRYPGLFAVPWWIMIEMWQLIWHTDALKN